MTLLLVAFVAATLMVGVVTAVLPRLGVMDVPNARSSHARPIPRGGGIAIVPALVVSVAFSAELTPELVWLAGGAAALGVVGLVDDVRGVSAPVRLTLQLVVTFVVAAGVLFHHEALNRPLLLLSCLAAAVWLTGFVNVYNFMDGANGVAGLQAVLAGAWFAHLGHSNDATTLTVAGVCVAGAALGFLPWNYPRARVFLGDVGSYSVGMLLGGLALVALLETGSLVAAAAPLIIFLADTGLTLLRRVARGDPVMTAHREHVYQRLTSRPGSPWPALVTAVATAACLAAALTALWLCLLLWLLVVCGYVALPRIVQQSTTQHAG